MECSDTELLGYWCSFPVAIFIGFEFASYTYEEQEANITTGQQLQVIHLIKSIESEQTFDIVIRATYSGGRPATFDVDYTAGAAVTQYDFRFDQDRLVFPITLLDDEIPEGTETFQLISLPLAGGAPFNPSVNSTTTVFILDNDCKCH